MKLSFSIAILSCLFFISCSGKSSNPELGQNFSQQIFETPQALVDTVKNALNNHDSEALLRVLGPKGRDLVFSGDPVSDRLEMDYLAQRMSQRAELIPYVSAEFQNVSIMKLRVGRMGTNAGIPIINEGKGWRLATGYFAPRSVKRRIATNEIQVWRACAEYVEAQRQYFQIDRDGDGIQEYALRFLSTPGKRDGLYWPAAATESESPLAEVIASASSKGYTAGTAEEPKPYHGYIFRILTAQGKSAKDGQRDYMQDGNMTKGFALVASPVEWSASGLRTFIVGPDGLIYGKNLGISSDRLAEEMKEYNPDRTWHWIQQPQIDEFEQFLDGL